MFELKPLICECCGGQIDRSTMKCLYCDTQYERNHDGQIIKYEVERPGIHRICAAVRLDDRLVSHNPEAARNYAMDKLRRGIADSLLDYLKLDVCNDYMSFCQIIRGEVMVLDPKFKE